MEFEVSQLSGIVAFGLGETADVWIHQGDDGHGNRNGWNIGAHAPNLILHVGIQRVRVFHKLRISGRCHL